MVWRGMTLFVLLVMMVVSIVSGVVSISTGKEMYCGACCMSMFWWRLVVEIDWVEFKRARFGWMC